MSTDNMAEYFSGRKLFGDDFSSEDVMRWHEEERNAYYSLGEQTEHEYNYSYHSLNWTYGFKYLGSRYYHNALGLGSAYADEFLPILGQIEHLTIIEPAVGFTRTSIRDVQVDYVEPTYDGTLFFPDSSFDLITCLGVLHHIPNVTHVVMELHRCLKKGGFLLLREPVVSMGDWRKPRAGLTKRERGIPERILEEIILGSGLTIVKQSKCMFSLTSRLRLFMKGPVYNSKYVVMLDRIPSLLFSWNTKYHATNPLHKLRPTSMFLVCSRQEFIGVCEIYDQVICAPKELR